jgi:TonB family protein
MWKSRTMRALTTLSWALLPFCLNCHAQETPELDKVADRIVQKLQKAKKQKVVVIDFPLAGQKVTALGQILANQLTSALTKRMTPNDVVTRAQLSERIGAMGLSPDDLREREIAFWLSGEAGATVTVFGSLAPREEKFVLSIELVSIKDSKLLLKTETDLPKNEQIIALLGKPPDWPPPPSVVVACSPTTDSGQTREAYEAAGATMPSCAYCPQPSYTDAARSAKYQGGCKFHVVVDENGRATSISLLDPAGNGLDVQAIKAIRNWRFKPATKDGKPVPVCVLIEVTFHLY